MSKEKIQITLTGDDINTFWNIIAFALDLDTKEHCMTEIERSMAKTLYEYVDDSIKYWET